MIFYVIIDTNVILSALLSKKFDTATVKVIEAVMNGKIIPLLHEDILAEYENVLYRDEFHLNPATIQIVLQAFKIYGVKVTPQESDENFSDLNDKIFYEVTLAKRYDNSYLVTGVTTLSRSRFCRYSSSNDFYRRRLKLNSPPDFLSREFFHRDNAAEFFHRISHI